ncbi:hypothetical protein DOS84_15675 [Flavobacterium aquariorum]|uniref:WG repeat-containing protein n=1 Tax=Flavobacterium aquariorum TaxID=2217670 RepID=A0A2W7TPV3_9FLAO|nr:hypothetical protein [Flavobacterium aquariorum]PZX92553.1 hypothetical protein DOS84_15675 [Flavobacterium aquariorum]
MKTKFLFLLLLVSSYGFSQSVNDYAAVIVPLKFDFLKSENQYRLNTLTKFNLQKAGFVAYYNNEDIPNELNNRCSLLSVDVLKESGFLITKLYVILKDCNGKVVFKSEVGKSKEKEYEVAYSEALNMAFASVYALHYKYNGGIASSLTPDKVVPITASVQTLGTVIAVNPVENKESNLLYAQPTALGFQLIDSTPKVVFKIFKTSIPNCFIAFKDNIQGVLIAKEDQWFFEYYQSEKLMSEKVVVKF